MMSREKPGRCRSELGVVDRLTNSNIIVHSSFLRHDRFSSRNFTVSTLNGVNFSGCRVEDVMLEHEDGVKEDRHDTQDEFHDVEAVTREHWVSKGFSINPHLQERERAASEVEQHIAEGPTNGTLSFPVEVDLGAVLDESDGGLTVTHHKEQVPVQVEDRMKSDLENESADQDQVEGEREDNDPPFHVTLFAALNSTHL